ncbi:MAG: hypothetical protein RLZZ536_106, partial [Planctomycetota bacterium]
MSARDCLYSVRGCLRKREDVRVDDILRLTVQEG